MRIYLIFFLCVEFLYLEYNCQIEFIFVTGVMFENGEVLNG